MKFRTLRSIFGVGFVSFSMLFGVSISSAFAMENSDGRLYRRAIHTYDSTASKEDNFILAASYGDLEKVQQLLPEVCVDCTNSMGFTALYYAAEGGWLDVVDFLLGRGATVDHIGFAGQTPLHAAALYGHLAVVQRLVERDANVNCADDAGCPPLDFAISTRHLDVVMWLEGHGAHANCVASNGSKPIDSAKHTGQHDVVEFLEDLTDSTDCTRCTNWCPIM